MTVHRLVQAVARTRSEANGSMQDAVDRLFGMAFATDQTMVTQTPNPGRSAPILTPHLPCSCGARVFDNASKPSAWAILLNRVGKLFPWTRGFPTSYIALERGVGDPREDARASNMRIPRRA